MRYLSVSFRHVLHHCIKQLAEWLNQRRCKVLRLAEWLRSHSLLVLSPSGESGGVASPAPGAAWLVQLSGSHEEAEFATGQW